MSPGRKLTILSAGYSLVPVGPDAVGGSEQILSALDHALVAAGHRSIVVGCEGSVAAGELVEVPAPEPGRPIDDDVRARAQAAMYAAIAGVLERVPVDLVHMHGLDFSAFMPPPGPPLLVTLHLPPKWYAPGALTPSRQRTWLHCVSHSQQVACPPEATLLPPIPNGVPVEKLAWARHARRSFALMLARICPEKGQDLALDAAHALGIPLLIGGELFPYPAHTDYYLSRVAPKLDRLRRFLGPVSFARKRRLLAAARCVLVPSIAPETSSLIAMEAAAAGTPVIAFNNGALAEVVEEGQTGFIVNSLEEMIAAIERAGDIDPALCRETARKRFSREVMIQRYFQLYDRLAR